jgi:beta-glucosidase
MSEPVDDVLARLLGELTRAEKCALVVGATMFTVNGCERLGIPEWGCSDGPVGVRGRGFGGGLLLPGPTAQAAMWDEALLHELGAAVGDEARDRNVALVLAPTVNIQRVPLAGRTFECFSEDPFLSARAAVAFITGVQSRRVGACVKHYVANEQEHQRHTISSELDERTLREIYLPPFEAAVRDAGVRSVMGAYNFVNGVHACAHHGLLVDVLKREWGFEGFVVSDWAAVKDTVGPAVGGMDLEMPGSGAHWGDGQLEAAVASGAVTDADLDDKVRRVLGFLDWCGVLGAATDHTETVVDRPEHRALARRAAAAAMVLVRNEPVPGSGPVLPLDLSALSSLALVGPGAAHTALRGGGSANLVPNHETTVLESLRARAPAGLDVRHAPGPSLRRTADDVPRDWWGDAGLAVELFAGTACDGEPVAVQRRRSAFNVWFPANFPAGVETLSVRLSGTLTPDRSGRHRIVPSGYGTVRLRVDGELVADNVGPSFSGQMADRAGVAWLELEAGRRYEVVLEHTPADGGQQLVLTRLGVELDEAPAIDPVEEAVVAAAACDVAVVVVGSNAEWESEGRDRDTLTLPADQDELVRRVAGANPRTVVVLNCGAPVALPWLHDVPAALLAWYPGQEGGDAVVDVLCGEADPGGRLPTTWPVRLEDTPAFTDYPGEAGVVRYGEGIFVGYRWYDARDIEPLVPFGHGGSFTTFSWGDPLVDGTAPELAVSVAVTNTGDRAGSEVVQCYLAPLDPPVARPPQELVGFAKLHLAPGETGRAEMTFGARAFARWDPGIHDWVVDPGRYELRLGASSRDVRAVLPVVVT